MGDWRAHYDRAIRDAQIQQRSDRGEIVRQMKRAEEAETEADRLRVALHVVLDEVDLLRAYSDRLDPQYVWGHVGRVERAALTALLADGDEDGDE